MPSAKPAKKKTTQKPEQEEATDGITAISVSGFKSIVEECRIDTRRLTILAGANNSGKSTIVQPLLLLKQTLDLGHDPGALWISGSNVRFSNVDQLFSKIFGQSPSEIFSIQLEVSRSYTNKWQFKKHPEEKLKLADMTFSDGTITTKFCDKMTKPEMTKFLDRALVGFRESVTPKFKKLENLKLVRKRFSLGLSFDSKTSADQKIPGIVVSPTGIFDEYISQLIHIPGWRGNPERTYPTSSIGPHFAGVFPQYVASIINNWKATRDPRLGALGKGLRRLGLTWKVDTRPVDDTKVEVLVGRLPRSVVGGARDMVNIADVGFGVSQILPILVALLAAMEGQTVYVEQPEIHLHPRAQVALAQEFVDAANRGVRLIIETHSAILLLAIQTLIAEKKIDLRRTKLYWFARKPEDGVTKVTEADLDETGSFGDWPQDFGEVTLNLQRTYLDAAEATLKRR